MSTGHLQWAAWLSALTHHSGTGEHPGWPGYCTEMEITDRWSPGTLKSGWEGKGVQPDSVFTFETWVMTTCWGLGPKGIIWKGFLTVWFLKDCLECDYSNWKNKCMLIVGKVQFFKDKIKIIMYETFCILNFLVGTTSWEFSHTSEWFSKMLSEYYSVVPYKCVVINFKFILKYSSLDEHLGFYSPSLI